MVWEEIKEGVKRDLRKIVGDMAASLSPSTAKVEKAKKRIPPILKNSPYPE